MVKELAPNPLQKLTFDLLALIKFKACAGHKAETMGSKIISLLTVTGSGTDLTYSSISGTCVIVIF